MQNDTTLHDDLGHDLKITRCEPRTDIGGVWVSGTLAGHRFEALVFAEHTESEEYELGRSRISKLWLRDQSSRQTVFNWDRGLDQPPTSPLAQAIVDFLAAGLAEHIFGK